MTALASTAFTHRHSLSYLHAIGSGWADPTDQYGCEWGVCRDCGRDITRLVEEGVKPRDNRHPFRTSEELELIEAAHAEALTACQHCGSAGHFVAGWDVTTKECRGCDARLLASDPDLCETCALHADAGPFRVESWNERP